MSTSRPGSGGEYIHGTAEGEQARLSRLNERLNASCLSRLALEPGTRVLEVGSGLGQMACSLAERVGPSGRVLGIERDPVHLERSRALAAGRGLRWLEIREGDATALPLAPEEAGSFDLAYCRFVLEHLARPEDAVREMVRAVRPGGRVALADDDHGLWHMHPPCEAFMRTWSAYAASYGALGCDARVGSRLPELLARAGARPVRVDTIFFGGCMGDPTWDDLIANMVEAVATARLVVERHGIMDGAEFARGLGAAEEWSRLPGASIWYPVCWAEGVRPAS